MNADESILNLEKVDLKNKHFLPEYSGIYYVLDENNIVWYIGKAKNLKKRWNGKAHHRLYQLSSQNKKKFYIYYNKLSEINLDEEEKKLIAQYRPHLNSSPVKKKRVLPAENLLRETILKLPDFLVILGIEPPRQINKNSITPDWWLKNKLAGLQIIHLMLDWEKLREFAEQDIEISSGILGYVFGTRKAYSNLWEAPHKEYVRRYGVVQCRILVNGYVVEVSVLDKVSQLLTKTRMGTLAGEQIKIVEADILDKIKADLKIPIPKDFVNKIQPYLQDPINLVFNDHIDRETLGKQIYRIKEEYKQGLRGVGSRIAKRISKGESNGS
ncbi:GIY-YIG nuclease family protein [Nostoc sp. 'Peltigera membranacea cyanobiont' N6]|uniref:GIY-YIG nuclease family protein n=1 Tax=Nostoc sp. 'Peltigera membranacea cyanobiont' N6 TaxID=1261031 RepID=UPI000CF35FA2|nr:excinuclease ABC subunit C [Nostoc sp. 'Peltigera membranacea cyanobiont' N6]AVH68456.1 excinuclease ABC subunit C [Nostoc sp. 'Peltigera membranacea cyanobiont' N6]